MRYLNALAGRLTGLLAAYIGWRNTRPLRRHRRGWWERVKPP